jgi:hypothetical protein
MATAVTTLMLAAPVVSAAQDPGTQLSLEQARWGIPARAESDQPEPRPRAGVSGALAAGSRASSETAAAAPAAAADPAAAVAPAPEAVTAAPSAGGPRSSVTAVTAAAGQCLRDGRTVIRPVASGVVLSTQWAASAPGNDVTYDLTGVTSTAYPATNSPFAAGTRTPGQRTCVVGGTIRGQADDSKPWQVYHDDYNAACVKIIALEWMEVHGLRCDNVEDGIKPQESAVNANNARFTVSGTYLTRIRDDCMENDYTVGGLLQDNLWEQCNTGISERPSRDRSWQTPASETLVLDRMLIGLYATPHIEDGKTVMGENALFKWSSSGNKVVIKCSIFKVDSVSLNGTRTMAMPPGTVVDDSECPDRPSTIVWLGGGDYPAWTAGMRVVGDIAVWDKAVAAWKVAHGVA